jgi:hypothetical protein
VASRINLTPGNAMWVWLCKVLGTVDMSTKIMQFSRKEHTVCACVGF